MSRVNGRTIIPTDIAEAKVLQELGLKTLRVPRGVNPYQVARRLRRATKPHPDLEYLRSISVPTRTISPALPPAEAPSVEVAAE